MAQKVVFKVLTMTDVKTRQKAIAAASDIKGIDGIAAELKDQTLTVTGEMDVVVLTKKLRKLSKVEIVSVGPAQEPEKKE
ncbi:hypothetical protein L1987_52904 [Smallanthus sonchifolius]|uniref:Uncharacterized protein n=1 Tax=Smallanthus sonchifolius TaxID=185202 RepID=A0ACB9ETX4_9ASTR|nr:hypothetical protein L1987_52904 [Smallanthus sonchifolius]